MTAIASKRNAKSTKNARYFTGVIYSCIVYGPHCRSSHSQKLSGWSRHFGRKRSTALSVMAVIMVVINTPKRPADNPNGRKHNRESGRHPSHISLKPQSAHWTWRTFSNDGGSRREKAITAMRHRAMDYQVHSPSYNRLWGSIVHRTIDYKGP